MSVIQSHQIVEIEAIKPTFKFIALPEVCLPCIHMYTQFRTGKNKHKNTRPSVGWYKRKFLSGFHSILFCCVQLLQQLSDSSNGSPNKQAAPCFHTATERIRH